MKSRRNPWRTISTWLLLAWLAFGYIAFVPGDTPGGNSLTERVSGQARDVLFNYVAWEADAFLGKILQNQSAFARYMPDDQGAKFVHDYLDLMRQMQLAQQQINKIYVDPSVPDPATASADLRARRDSLSAEIAQKQPLAEAIIEQQIEAVLHDEGIGIGGAVMPPVSTHLTQLPMLIVISPRNTIRFDAAIEVYSMPDDQATRLEDSIDNALNVSSLVVPLGGLSLYPTMAEQSWYAPAVFETVAHEWTHNYLYFFPLGLEYESDSETRIINESTAVSSGTEIGLRTLRRFYSAFPDIVSQLPAPAPAPGPSATPNAPQPTPTAPVFDFGAAMNETRVTVDSLLAQGKVTEAEQYMESRRQVFVAQGYGIRKLNQAYFAFYGGYQAAGQPGAGGSDPTGAAIAEIRQRTGSYKAWLETMRTITSRSDLLAERDTLHGKQATPTP